MVIILHFCVLGVLEIVMCSHIIYSFLFLGLAIIQYIHSLTTNLVDSKLFGFGDIRIDIRLYLHVHLHADFSRLTSE